MNLTTMTTNEQERLAYAEGYIEVANLLARLDDLEHTLENDAAELEKTRDKLDVLEYELDEKKDEYAMLFSDYVRMREERDELHAAVRTAIDMLTAEKIDVKAISKLLHAVTW